MKYSSEDAKELMNLFFLEMNQWEKQVIKLYRPENGGPEKNQETSRAALKSIFDKFVTPRERKWGRVEGMAVSLGSPDYDPNLESITKIETTRTGFSVETKKIYPENNYFELYKYKIKLTNSHLFVDSRKRYSKLKDKWVTDIL